MRTADVNAVLTPSADKTQSFTNLSDASLQAALNAHARSSLRPVALGVGLVYALLAAGLLLTESTSEAAAAALSSAGVAAILLALFYLLNFWQPPLAWAQPLIVGLGGLVLLNNVFVHLTLDLGQQADFLLVIVGAGFLLLSARWLVVLLVMTGLAWALVALEGYSYVGWRYIAMAYAAAVMVAVIAHISRVRVLRRLEQLRWHDQQRQVELEAAVQDARQHAERFHALADAAFEGVAVLMDGQIVDANPALAEMLGYASVDELIGRPPAAFVAPEAREALRQAIVTGEPESIEAVGLRRDGERRLLELHHGRIPYRDGVARVVAVRDITERKQTEAAREQLIEELDAFSHTVAHDLKNPLALMQGYAELLLATERTLTRDERLNYLELIVQNAFKMGTIIDELLLLAHLRQDEVPALPVQMGAVVAEACQRLSYMIDEYQAGLVLPEHWPMVLGHSTWIEEVWINYLSNAIKYGGQPPRLELGADVLPDGRVRCWVRDNGAGLTADEQRQLFVPFTQLSDLNTKGHGLGLSIVRRIVEKLGGEVGVESEVGQGSTFSFTLPGVPPDFPA